ncbi:MAG: LysM peptidoglycan-binding domain-containing protein [Candidatus Goldbacteria bacterium]|nr:LysM peptidoglycan-binding domain-containing protein [Candidatus Goldiibacteriota bacterium]
MRKIFAITIAGLFLFWTLFFIGCGAKSQKISSAADEESQVMEEAKTAAKETLPSTYIVEAGDTLWSIAAKPEIYGNKYQWPLIYDANRDILDSYNTPLQEGQKLIIPRNVSAVEIEAAKERAKELGIPDSGEEKIKVASKRKITDYEDEQNKKIVGLSEKKQPEQKSYVEESEIEEEPTPIPEPSKPKKKGKINIIPLFLIILGVLLLIIFFIFSRQKKEEEEEEKEGGSKTNILE